MLLCNLSENMVFGRCRPVQDKWFSNLFVYVYVCEREQLQTLESNSGEVEVILLCPLLLARAFLQVEVVRSEKAFACPFPSPNYIT